MELYLQRPHAGSNAAGLATVIALHMAIGLGLLYGLATSKAHIVKTPDAYYIPVDRPKPADPQKQPVRNSKWQPAVVTVEPPVIPLVPVTEPTMARSNDAPTTPSDSGPGSDNAITQPSNTLGIACPNAQSIRSAVVYPAQALRHGLQGDVLARFIVSAAGDIRNVQIVQSSNRAFNAPAVAAVLQLQCRGQGQDVAVEMPFSFRLE